MNTQKDDNFCFLWCISAHKYRETQNKNRPTSFSKSLNILNVKGLEFPMRVKDIPKFEKLNYLNVNLFELT